MGPKWDLYTRPSLRDPWTEKSTRTKILTFFSLLHPQQLKMLAHAGVTQYLLSEGVNGWISLRFVILEKLQLLFELLHLVGKMAFLRHVGCEFFQKSTLRARPHLDTLSPSRSPDSAVHRILRSSHLGVYSLMGSSPRPCLVISAAALHHRTEFSEVWLHISFEKDCGLCNRIQKSHILLTALTDSHAHSRKR